MSNFEVGGTGSGSTVSKSIFVSNLSLGPNLGNQKNISSSIFNAAELSSKKLNV
jgi:hypothetical protein